MRRLRDALRRVSALFSTGGSCIAGRASSKKHCHQCDPFNDSLPLWFSPFHFFLLLCCFTPVLDAGTSLLHTHIQWNLNLSTYFTEYKFKFNKKLTFILPHHEYIFSLMCISHLALISPVAHNCSPLHIHILWISTFCCWCDDKTWRNGGSSEK